MGAGKRAYRPSQLLLITGDLAQKVREARALDHQAPTPARANRARDLLRYFSEMVGKDQEKGAGGGASPREGVMKVYLASRYQDLVLMQEWRNVLQSHGIAVTSRWINGGHVISRDAASDEERCLYAEEDIEDLCVADLLIAHSPRLFFGSGRGGRHVELGYALALKKSIILVGDRENVFHWMCVRVDSLDDAIAYLQRAR